MSARTGWEKPYRTLGKGGISETFATREQALVRAQQVADETGQWCGVEQRSSNGWWLTDSIEPEVSAS